jgi:hypothetical protein
VRVHLRIRPGQEHYFSPATGTLSVRMTLGGGAAA